MSITTDDVKSVGMHARPVIGGVFIAMLADTPTWLKWAHEDPNKATNWATLPVAPTVVDVVRVVARGAPQTWHYTTDQARRRLDKRVPFNDAAWKSGPGGFGTRRNARRGHWYRVEHRRYLDSPHGHPSCWLYWTTFRCMLTTTKTSRSISMAFSRRTKSGYNNSYAPLDISKDAMALLKPGATITIAAHCHQTTGGQGVDVGLVKVTQSKQ